MLQTIPTCNDKIDIAKALEGLYIAQGKGNKENKDIEIQLFVFEILSKNYPLNVVLTGIKSLYEIPLKEIKLYDVLNAVQGKFQAVKSDTHGKCGLCENGLISIRNTKDILDAKKRRCLCEEGRTKVGNNIRQYVGREIFENKVYKALTNKDMDCSSIKQAWYN